MSAELTHIRPNDCSPQQLPPQPQELSSGVDDAWWRSDFTLTTTYSEINPKSVSDEEPGKRYVRPTANANAMWSEVELSDDHERFELEADAHNVGSIALAEWVRVSVLMGNPAELPEPQTARAIDRKSLIPRRHVLVFNATDDFKLRPQFFAKVGPKEEVTKARDASGLLDTDLARLGASDSSVQDQYIDERIASLRANAVRLTNMDNVEMIFDGADLPPVIRTAIDSYDGTWVDWFRSAPKEQIVNFSEWYLTQVKKLADPIGRESAVQEYKQRYLDVVEGAVSAGWLRQDHLDQARRAVGRAKVAFFSPFGGKSWDYGAFTQSNGIFRPRSKQLVGLPIAVGAWTSVHEFGHVFNNLDSRTFSANQYLDSPTAVSEISTLFIEGYNEHMTAALLDGAPEVISPREREARDIAETKGSSDLYKDYREVFALLVEGDARSQAFTVRDMATVVDTLSDGKKLKQFLESRWSGRDILEDLRLAVKDALAAPRQGDKRMSGTEVTISTCRRVLQTLRAQSS